MDTPTHTHSMNTVCEELDKLLLYVYHKFSSLSDKIYSNPSVVRVFAFISMADVQLMAIGYRWKHPWIAKDLCVCCRGCQDVVSLGFHQYPVIRPSFDY